MDNDQKIKEFEDKLKIKLAKLGFSLEWLYSSNYIEARSSRELVEIDKAVDALLKAREEKESRREE
tara:strand:- start:362 stop:559 length:198 start_codon:yes stop_codon:yes gene_type:complete